MKTWLLQQFEQYSIAWIFIMTFIGAIIGSGFRFIFDKLLHDRVNVRNSEKKALKEYTYSLKSTSESLYNYIKMYLLDTRSYSSENNYFKLSLIYWFSAFFGWITFFENKCATEISNHKQKIIIRLIYHVKKSLNSFNYFGKIYPIDVLDKYSFHNMKIRAIGEIMMVGNGKIASFIEFLDLYKNEKNGIWFHFLDNFLRDVRESDIKINRLYLMQINLLLLSYSIKSYNSKDVFKRLFIKIKFVILNLKYKAYKKKNHSTVLSHYIHWKNGLYKKDRNPLFPLYASVKMNIFSEMRLIEKNIGTRFKLSKELNLYYQHLFRERLIFNSLKHENIFHQQKIIIIHKKDCVEDESTRGYVREILPTPLQIKYANDKICNYVNEFIMNISSEGDNKIIVDLTIEYMETRTSICPTFYTIQKIHENNIL